MLEVLGGLHRHHCLGQGPADPGPLQQRGVECLHDELDCSVGDWPQGDEDTLGARRQQGPAQTNDPVLGGGAVPVPGVAAGDDHQLGGQLEVQKVSSCEQELSEGGQLNGCGLRP